MTRKWFKWMTPLAVALALGACGGGGGGGGGSAGGFFPPVGGGTGGGGGAAAGGAVDDFIAFVKGLVTTAPATTEPVDVSQFDPAPTTETAEPVKVD